MRRKQLFLVVLAAVAAPIGGCGLFSTHTDVAAEAAGQQLPAQRLAEILSGAKGIRLVPEVADFVANLWVDLTLFSQAVANNKVMTDSSLVADAMWPMVADELLSSWRDSIVKVPESALDSAIKVDSMRVVQHILLTADSSTPKAAKEELRKRMEGILAQVKKGENFSGLAIANSQDPGSVADSGFMAPTPRGSFVAAFDKAAWALKPGEVSGIVETPFGFHIIRRASVEEAKARWRPALAKNLERSTIPAATARLDTVYQVKADKDVAPRMRAALTDMDGQRSSKAVLTTYKGGEYTVTDFIRFLRAFTPDPSQRQQMVDRLKAQPDSLYPMIAKELTANSLILLEADKMHIKIGAGEWKAMQMQFNVAVDSLKATLGLDDKSLDPKASTSERSKIAAAHVDKYFTDIVVNHAQLRTPPGMLAWVLRGKSSFKVYPVGLKRAIDLAQAKNAADSLKNGAAGPINPAAGPAPMPGGAVKTAPPAAAPPPATKKKP